MTDHALGWLIVGMALVTYIPRLAPFALLHRWSLPFGVRRVLEQIPAAALGALLIPDALNALPGRPGVAAVGLGVAVVLSLAWGNLILTVMGAVGAVYVLLL